MSRHADLRAARQPRGSATTVSRSSENLVRAIRSIRLFRTPGGSYQTVAPRLRCSTQRPHGRALLNRCGEGTPVATCCLRLRTGPEQAVRHGPRPGCRWPPYERSTRSRGINQPHPARRCSLGTSATPQPRTRAALACRGDHRPGRNRRPQHPPAEIRLIVRASAPSKERNVPHFRRPPATGTGGACPNPHDRSGFVGGTPEVASDTFTVEEVGQLVRKWFPLTLFLGPDRRR